MSRLFQNNEIIGDYRIDGFLGAGGMGEVYRGVHLNLNRVAAIKVMSSLAPNDSLTTRFYNEARLQSSLHHPNIAALYDFKNVNGKLCIFMEYVNGESLEDLINRRFFAVEDALLAFQSICEAIAFIHRNGILHRDIKSQNIKLDSRGTIKLLDFGIAKDAESQKLTKPGGVIGTPGYIAPEQFDGKAADFQTDVWALGILLYEMLTGNQPFKADSLIELCLKIESGEYVLVEKANPAVPHEISRIVERCLKKEKHLRYRNAGELAQETAQVLANKYDGLTVNDSGGYSKIQSVKETSLAEANFIQPPPKRSRLIPVVWGSFVAVLIIFGLIGIGVWAMSGGQLVGNSNGAKSNEILVVKKSDSPKDRNKSLIETTSASGESGEVRIDVFEGSAELFRNGESVGKTPLAIKGRVGEKINVKLRREGYKDYETQIEISSGKRNYTFTLQKK